MEFGSTDDPVTISSSDYPLALTFVSEMTWSLKSFKGPPIYNSSYDLTRNQVPRIIRSK